MSVSVQAIVLTTSKLEAMKAFYEAIGLPLEDERHEGGPPHFACELGAVHFAIYEAKAGEAVTGQKANMLGFSVPSLEAAFAAAKQLGAKVDREPEERPWGRRAIVVDPDGRRVELNQAQG
jgi:predicted enzyme related to lactoylglutathione lyase